MVAKLAFTPQTKIWLFYALKDAGYMAWVSYAIFFSCLLYYCFYLLFFEDLTVVRKYTNYTIKIYCWLYFLAVFFINLWLGGFICCIFFWSFLLIFSFWFLRLSSLLFLSLWFIILGLSCSPFLGYLTPSCVHFLNYVREGEEFPSYFKEGEETFCSLNVVFSWGMLGWGA